MMIRLLAFIIMCFSSAVWAEESLEDFAFAMPVDGVGNDALYRLRIPQTVYEGAAYADLRDLRVFNGNDEIVPHAFRPVEKRTRERAAIDLPFFVLRGPRGSSAADLDISLETNNGDVSLRVKSKKGNTSETDVVGYLIDLSSEKRSISSLTLEWGPEPPGYTASVDIEASSDLKRWSTIVRGAPLVRLAHGEYLLEQKTIDLRASRRKYLRLTWASGDVVQLHNITGRLTTVSVPPARGSKEVIANASGKDGEYLADMGGIFAVDRLTLHLPQDNAVAPLDIYSRQDPHDEWRRVTRTVAYRLRQNGQLIENPSISFSPRAHRYWKLEVNQRGGGIGEGSIRMRAGWIERELVFAARGPAPFRIAFGNGRAQPNALGFHTLVPHRNGDPVAGLKVVTASDTQTIAGPGAARQRMDLKKLALWMALIAGVAVLGIMAWRLSRQIQVDND